MVLLDTTVLAVAAPDLMADLHTDVVGVGWATTSYTMFLAAALVLAGALTDRLGPARVFLGGVTGFGVVSLACAAAPGLPALLAARAALGLLAAAIIPSSMSLLVRLYPDPARRTRAISIWAAVSGAAMAAGPVIGGLLIEPFGWRAVFVVNAPPAAVVVLLCVRRLPVAATPRPVSFVPHLLLVAALAAGTLALSAAGRMHGVVAGAGAGAALLLGVLTLVADRRSAAPIVPAALRRNAPARAAFAWGAVVNHALATVLFVVPLTLHQDAPAVGISLLPMTVLVALNPLATGRIVARFGPLVPIRRGLLAFAAGLLVTAAALAGVAQPVLLPLGLLCCGLGVSWTLPPLVGYAVSQVDGTVAGAAGGILNAARQAGATCGVAVAGAVLALEPDGGRWSSIPLLGSAGLCLVGLVIARRQRHPGV
ncbi:MFS transporter [Myceligenerans sp. I2]|uniref:MFS transporter n=2 Tax=Myceligenerans indicum TaxID=2593663 RepID=A0ABS1LSW8_9MICO|nr:MFS transporter [Myceligenerans indicum]